MMLDKHLKVIYLFLHLLSESAIKMELNNSNAIDMDSELENPFTDKDSVPPVFQSINEVRDQFCIKNLFFLSVIYKMWPLFNIRKGLHMWHYTFYIRTFILCVRLSGFYVTLGYMQLASGYRTMAKKAADTFPIKLIPLFFASIVG